MNNITSRIARAPAATLVILSLQACPVGLDHPLEERAGAAADPGLLGTWKNLNEDGSAEISRVRLSSAEDGTYRIELLGTTENFMAQDSLYTGWTTELDGRKFIVALADREGEYYHYCYELDGDQLVTHDFSLLDGGVDSVVSTASLREQLALSLQRPECLTSRQVWQREGPTSITRPNTHHPR